MKRLVSLIAFLLIASIARADRTIYTGETTAAQRGIPIYLVDATDNETEETGIAISGSECRICKNGAACGNCAGTWIEAENGIYEYQFTTGEIDTLGSVTVRISDSAANKFVGTANIVAYDPTDAQWTVDIAANGIPQDAYAAHGTAQAVTPTTLQMAASEAYATDELKNNTAVTIVSATAGAGQTRCVRGNVGSTDTLTVDSWATSITGTILYDLIAAPDCTVTASTVAADAIGASELASDAATEIATAVGTVVLNPVDGTAQAVGANTIQLAASETYGNNALIDNNSIWIVSSTNGKGQVLCVASNVASTDTVTLVKPWSILPTGTITYRVVRTPNCNPAKWPLSR